MFVCCKVEGFNLIVVRFNVGLGIDGFKLCASDGL